MRRDQTLKLCCNHFITADMTLNPAMGSDRAWMWMTLCELEEEDKEEGWRRLFLSLPLPPPLPDMIPGLKLDNSSVKIRTAEGLFFYCTLLCCIVPYYNTVLYYIYCILYCIVPYYTVFYCIILYHTVLYYTVLY